jgi:putative metallohydrolase (TIGR04338 family)
MQMRDYQRGKIYAWQTMYIARNYGSAWESLSDMQKLAKYIFKQFHLSTATVETSKRLRFHAAHYLPDTKAIEFHPYWIRKWVLLHEIAHHMSPTNHDHSSLYVKNLCILFHRYMKVPKDILRKSLANYKIDYEDF